MVRRFPPNPILETKNKKISFFLFFRPQRAIRLLGPYVASLHRQGRVPQPSFLRLRVVNFAYSVLLQAHTIAEWARTSRRLYPRQRSPCLPSFAFHST